MAKLLCWKPRAHCTLIPHSSSTADNKQRESKAMNHSVSSMPLFPFTGQQRRGTEESSFIIQLSEPMDQNGNYTFGGVSPTGFFWYLVSLYDDRVRFLKTNQLINRDGHEINFIINFGQFVVCEVKLMVAFLPWTFTKFWHSFWQFVNY